MSVRTAHRVRANTTLTYGREGGLEEKQFASDVLHHAFGCIDGRAGTGVHCIITPGKTCDEYS